MSFFQTKIIVEQSHIADEIYMKDRKHWACVGVTFPHVKDSLNFCTFYIFIVSFFNLLSTWSLIHTAPLLIQTMDTSNHANERETAAHLEGTH